MIGIEIAIGIEIEALDIDSDPDPDLDCVSQPLGAVSIRIRDYRA
jgi:hypothetical protein